MATADLLVYGLLLIPFIGTLIAGYAKLKVGPFFGITVALGATATLLSYLLLDLTAALWQLAALGIGALLFLASIGIFGERFSYRAPMLLLSAVGLFPLGLILGAGYLDPLVAYGILLGANLLFALLLTYLRRNNIQDRKGRPKAKDRYLLTIPTVVSTVVVGLMVLAKFGEGSLF